MFSSPSFFRSKVMTLAHWAYLGSIQDTPVRGWDKLTFFQFYLSGVFYSGLLLTSSCLPVYPHFLTSSSNALSQCSKRCGQRVDWEGLSVHMYPILENKLEETHIGEWLWAAFLSRPVEIGLMKRWTLSDHCQQHSFLLVPPEVDHHTSADTFFFSSVLPPFLPLTNIIHYIFCVTACLLFLHSPFSTLTYTHCHSGILPPNISFCSYASAPSFHGKAPFMRQLLNKWWSAVQRVGLSSSVNMDGRLSQRENVWVS